MSLVGERDSSRDASRVTGETGSPEAVGQRIADHLTALFAAKASALYRVDPESGRLELIATSGRVGTALGEIAAFPPGAGMADLAAREGRPIATSDLLADPRSQPFPELRTLLEPLSHRALVCVPLRTEARVIGVLALGDETGRAFAGEEVRLLGAFAEAAAAALQAIHLWQATGERLRHTETILSIAAAVGSTLDLTEILRRTTRELVRVLGADMGGGWFLSEDRDRFSPVVGYHVPKELLETFAGWALPVSDPLVEELKRTDGAIYSRASSEDPRFDHSLARLLPHKSFLLQPVWLSGELVGAFAIVWVRNAHSFIDGELRLVEEIARQAAGALQNAWLYEEAERRRREMEVLAELARGIHASLDPGTVFQRVADGARELCRSDLAGVAFRESTSDVMAVRYRAGYRHPGGDARRIEPGKELEGQALLTGRPFRTDRHDDPRPGSDAAAVREEGIVARMGVPILIDDSVEGLLLVGNRTSRPFRDRDESTLLRLAGYAAIAIRNARLLAETDRRRRTAESLAMVGSLISQSLDPEEVGQRIVDSVRGLVGALRATLTRLEPESGTVQVLAIAGEEAFPLGPGVARLAIDQRQPVVIADLLDDSRIAFATELRGHVSQLPVRAVLSVPLLLGEQVIGALSVGDRAGRVFNDDEIQLLQAFAGQAAIAIQNADLYEETRYQQQEAVALEEVARQITSSLKQEEVFQRIIDRARELCGSDLACLGPYNADAGTATIVAVSGERGEFLTGLVIAAGQGAGGRVLETGEPFTTDDYLADPRISREFADVATRLGTRALAVVPLKFRGAITGLLWVLNRVPRPFAARDLSILTKFADQAAIALENSRLYANADELAVTRERLRVAAELHDTLSQILFSVGLKLDWCLRQLPRPSRIRTRLEEIKEEAGFMMREMRELITRLSSGYYRGGSFVERLRILIDQFRDLTGIPVELIDHGDWARLPHREQEVLQKTFQEALANVAKHARASRATIRIEAAADNVRFEVADDGVGPPEGDLAQIAEAPGHFGLRQMRNRIVTLGGWVEFGRGVPSGFRLSGTLPLE